MIVSENHFDVKYYRVLRFNSPMFWLEMVIGVYAVIRSLRVLMGVALRGNLGKLFGMKSFWIWLIFFGILLTAITLKLPSVTKRIRDRNSPNAYVKWTFTAEGFGSDFSKDGAVSHTDYDYDHVVFAKRRKGYYELKIAQANYVCVLTESFIQGTAEEFEILLREKLGNRCVF